MVIQSGAASTAEDDDATTAALFQEAIQAQDDLDVQGADLARALHDIHALQDAFEKNVQRRAKALGTLPSAHPAVPELQARLKTVSRLTPSSGGFFVEMFLGSVNVRFMRKSERLSFKTDYERIKQRLAPLFAFVCVLCLYFRENRWLHMIFQLALATYYVALAIRENILRINGSNIKPWWILHHYLTMVSSVLLLTWPNGPSYASFRTGLHYYGLYNAILQIFQTRYQIARLYTLRSLGMAGEMDVANSDSTQIHWSESMKLLLPLIVLGQILQAGQALSLLRIYIAYPHELQILLLAVLFFVLFIGNAMTTTIVVFEKRKSVPAASPPRQQAPAPVPIPSASPPLPLTTLRARAVPERTSHNARGLPPRPPLNVESKSAGARTKPPIVATGTATESESRRSDGDAVSLSASEKSAPTEALNGEGVAEQCTADQDGAQGAGIDSTQSLNGGLDVPPTD